MELEEESDDYLEDCEGQGAQDPDDGVDLQEVPRGGDHPGDLLDEERSHEPYRREHCDYHIEQEQHEELPVHIPHTVRDPGAVVIHVEHTSPARRAMMTPK